MDAQLWGVAAAFGTTLCWTSSSICFEAAGKRIGSLTVNLLRLALALALMSVVLCFTRGSPLPLDFPAEAWGWLLLSGFVGFFLGDLFLFRAFVEIGPRLAMLIMSLSVPLTYLIGWQFLGEAYSVREWVAMAVTLAGVMWVILERPAKKVPGVEGDGSKGAKLIRNVNLRGVLLGLGGALGQAVGYILSKRGMGELDALAASQIRMLAGTASFALLFFALRRWGKVREAFANPGAVAYLSAGAVLGPLVGATLSLLALHYTTAGVASTIIALVPIFLIPPAVLIQKEHVSLRAALGAGVAVTGVVLLVS